MPDVRDVQVNVVVHESWDSRAIKNNWPHDNHKRTTGQAEAVWNETHSFHGLNNISCSGDKLSAETIATRLSSINLGGGQTNNGSYFLVANTCVQMKLISGAQLQSIRLNV